jgi:hypothetical protein
VHQLHESLVSERVKNLVATSFTHDPALGPQAGQKLGGGSLRKAAGLLQLLNRARPLRKTAEHEKTARMGEGLEDLAHLSSLLGIDREIIHVPEYININILLEDYLFLTDFLCFELHPPC